MSADRPCRAVDDPGILLERAHQQALQRLDPVRVEQVRAWIAAMDDEGQWAGIDLAARDHALWPPLAHLERLGAIAVASGRAGPLAADVTATAALIRGLMAWQRQQPASDNWWHNDIGAPQQGVQILASRPDLPAAALEVVLSIVGPAPIRMTGQNRVWLASINLLLSAYRGQAADVQTAVDAITSTLVLSTDEGPQHDGSFHQHGAQFYSGGYGRSWVRDLGALAALLHGTPWAFTPDQMQILELVSLDGLGWMLRDGWLDPICMGREATRALGHCGHDLAAMAQAVAGQDGLRAADWQHLAAVAAGQTPYLQAGARHFWRSDASVLHRPAFSVGILAATTRTLRTESGNDENLLGALFADGATWIRRRGDAFHRLAPVLDWAALPGTTATADVVLRPQGWSVAAESSFGGGLGTGRHLVHGWDLVRGQTRAAQAWFGVEQGLVVLLAGINHPDQALSSTGPVMPVAGPVLHDGRPLVARQVLQAGQAVVHDGLAWLAVDGRWEVEARQGQGSWRRANASQADDPVHVEVLSMRADLGRAPHDAAVAWAVLEAVDGRPPLARFTVLANTPQVQAVADHDGTVLAVFRSAGTIADITVDGPAIVLADRQRLLVADPLRPGGDRHLTLSKAGQRWQVALPTGAMAGSPVMVGL